MNSRLSLPAFLLPSARRTAAFAATLVLSSWMGATVHAQTLFVSDPNTGNGVSSYNLNGSLINSSVIAGNSFEGLALNGSTLYVTNPGPGQPNLGKVGSYTFDGTGALTSSVPFFAAGGGLNAPFGLATTSTNLYIADFNSGNILKYDFSGTQLSAANVGFTNPYGLAVAGNILWVSQATTGTGANTIKGFDLSTLTLSTTITSGLSTPEGMAVSGSTLYVVNEGSGTVGTFDAVTGAPIGTLISGLSLPHGITIYGSSLFVTGGDGTVKGFDATTGAPLAGFTTITGLSAPNGVVVASFSTASAIPEPSTYAALAGAAMLGVAVWSRRRSTSVTKA